MGIESNQKSPETKIKKTQKILTYIKLTSILLTIILLFTLIYFKLPKTLLNFKTIKNCPNFEKIKNYDNFCEKIKIEKKTKWLSFIKLNQNDFFINLKGKLIKKKKLEKQIFKEKKFKINYFAYVKNEKKSIFKEEKEIDIICLKNKECFFSDLFFLNFSKILSFDFFFEIYFENEILENFEFFEFNIERGNYEILKLKEYIQIFFYIINLIFSSFYFFHFFKNFKQNWIQRKIFLFTLSLIIFNFSKLQNSFIIFQIIKIFFENQFFIFFLFFCLIFLNKILNKENSNENIKEKIISLFLFLLLVIFDFTNYLNNTNLKNLLLFQIIQIFTFISLFIFCLIFIQKLFTIIKSKNKLSEKNKIILFLSILNTILFFTNFFFKKKKFSDLKNSFQITFFISVNLQILISQILSVKKHKKKKLFKKNNIEKAKLNNDINFDNFKKENTETENSEKHNQKNIKPSIEDLESIKHLVNFYHFNNTS